MSSESHNHKSKPNEEHGTVWSYVIGFILSLIYTIIPYQLVVNKILTGNALLAAILAIAVLQMAIQLLFFLHLGRGPKPLYNIIFFFATAGIIVMTIGASLFIMDNLYRNMLPDEVTIRLAQEENIAQVGGEQTGACTEPGNSHIVTIKYGRASPNYVAAARCDTLTFVNEDDNEHMLGFGTHHAHKTYGGEDGVTVSGGRSETITLNQVGDFSYFDHLDTEMTGKFMVNQ